MEQKQDRTVLPAELDEKLMNEVRALEDKLREQTSRNIVLVAYDNEQLYSSGP